MVDGRGGRLGPDLSDVGWKRSAGFLKESILEPTAEIGNSSETFVDGTRRYWPVTLTLADGNSVQGVVLNEDSYSIQVMDEEERLLSYTKKLLKRFAGGRSRPCRPFKTISPRRKSTTWWPTWPL